MMDRMAQIEDLKERHIDAAERRVAVGFGRGRGRGRGFIPGGRGCGCNTPLPRRHGKCAHNGHTCKNLSDGHISTATFAIMQTDSTLSCK